MLWGHHTTTTAKPLAVKQTPRCYSLKRTKSNFLCVGFFHQGNDKIQLSLDVSVPQKLHGEDRAEAFSRKAQLNLGCHLHTALPLVSSLSDHTE